MGAATQNALDAIPAVAGFETSFASFTVTLVREVMDALVSSQISQMRSFAELVSELERGLSQFKAGRITKESITTWIIANCPDANPGDLKILTKNSCDAIDQLLTNKLPELFPLDGARKYILKNNGTPWSIKPEDNTKLDAIAIGIDEADSLNPLESSTAGQGDVQITLTKAIATAFAEDAEESYTELNKLVQMGMQKMWSPKAIYSQK